MIASRRSSVLLVPLLAWLALLLALAGTVAYAIFPGAPAKVWVAAAISAVKASLIGIFFMRLQRAPPLLRITALAGLLWLAVLFLLGFCDYLTRVRGGP